MNTAIHLMYRDGANYKKFGRIVLPGGHTPEQVQELTGPCLDSDGFFVPEAVGIETLREGWDDDLDHAFHTITDVEATDDAPTDKRTMAELIAEFRGKDWAHEGVLVAERH